MTQKRSPAEVYFEIEDRFKELVEKHGRCETVHDFIDRFCTTRDEDRPADTMQIYRGWAPGIDMLWKSLPPSFSEKEEWSQYPFRVVWISDEEWSTVTYCEGDLAVTLHPRRASFLLELEYSEEHYVQH